VGNEVRKGGGGYQLGKKSKRAVKKRIVETFQRRQGGNRSGERVTGPVRRQTITPGRGKDTGIRNVWAGVLKGN